jgi:hypothetical protein
MQQRQGSKNKKKQQQHGQADSSNESEAITAAAIHKIGKLCCYLSSRLRLHSVLEG